MDVWTTCKPFVTGSMAGCIATTFIQPIDMVKVRIQLGAAKGGSTSPVEIAKSMLRDEGPRSFYKGLSAGYLRQVLYTGTRLGLYDKFTGMAMVPGEPLPFWKSTICALGAGGIGAVIGNPADLTLIRMQSDNLLPVAERRGYRHVFHALNIIVKEESAAGLFKGYQATAARAMALNFGMLSFSTKAKEQLSLLGCAPGSASLVFGAAAVGGFFGAFFSLPFDFVKTQVQQMKPDPITQEMPYKGPVDCALKTFKAAPLRFYAGFPTYFMRTAPLSMITLIAQDVLKKMWKDMGV
ncbi:unnamed protein product [Polarella glacialis]|uniref:Uncharacterized protein n=1 Tax=Polarella glacialis TaxID=89957 RepID=A0A813HB78_POLGL|nr:unnamed protein product [Polarella glacialis]CAE8660881.1 unnamed protein product [Polarella glacialis]CAE8680457.1 unnamed protein product [Polarella glacialis]|mmetsp:Transcript_24967/g.44391  ORF Transcript_24967/g.44391 Transcript_24967/m.44391 type:complete len:295 (+) Transcript_24967:84-968(+)